MKKILFIIVLSLFVVSCEEVIELELRDADPKLVVEGTITNAAGPYIVKLSKSRKFYENNNFEYVQGATVVVSDDKGNSETLTELTDGRYRIDSLTGIPESLYTIDIQSEGDTYTGSSYMPKVVKVDTFNLYYDDGKSSIFKPEGYYINMTFVDPAEDNYYWVKAYQGRGEVKSNGRPMLGADYQFGGEKGAQRTIQIDLPFAFGTKDNTTVVDSGKVFLYSLAKDDYDFYTTLQELSGAGGSFGSIPKNPLSNISNGGLGYFGAFAVDSIVFEIK